jgi:hypothetical protein
MEEVMQPQKVLITRTGTDQDHERLHHAPGVIIGEPHVGESLQVFLDDGKMMQTTAVTRVEDDDGELIVDTRNSRYRLKLAS